MFTFEIVSTLSITNACDGFINAGDVLYGPSTIYPPDPDALTFATADAARAAAERMMEELEGNAGFNEALASADIVIRSV